MFHVSVLCVVVSFPCSLVVMLGKGWPLGCLFGVFCHLPKCVLVHIRFKGEVGAVKLVLALQQNILLTVPGGTSFVDLLCFFLSRVCYAFVRVCLFVPCGHLLEKG